MAISLETPLGHGARALLLLQGPSAQASILEEPLGGLLLEVQVQMVAQIHVLMQVQMVGQVQVVQVQVVQVQEEVQVQVMQVQVVQVQGEVQVHLLEEVLGSDRLENILL